MLKKNTTLKILILTNLLTLLLVFLLNKRSDTAVNRPFIEVFILSDNFDNSRQGFTDTILRTLLVDYFNTGFNSNLNKEFKEVLINFLKEKYSDDEIHLRILDMFNGVDYISSENAIFKIKETRIFSVLGSHRVKQDYLGEEDCLGYIDIMSKEFVESL